jgi:hypothetical protein
MSMDADFQTALALSNWFTLQQIQLNSQQMQAVVSGVKKEHRLPVHPHVPDAKFAKFQTFSRSKAKITEMTDGRKVLKLPDKRFTFLDEDTKPTQIQPNACLYDPKKLIALTEGWQILTHEQVFGLANANYVTFNKENVLPFTVGEAAQLARFNVKVFRAPHLNFFGEKIAKNVHYHTKEKLYDLLPTPIDWLEEELAKQENPLYLVFKSSFKTNLFVYWNTPLELPLGFARYFVKLTDSALRVHRLQELSWREAFYEGYTQKELGSIRTKLDELRVLHWYREVWDNRHGKTRNGSVNYTSWQSNPWVWLLSFGTVLDARKQKIISGFEYENASIAERYDGYTKQIIPL